MAWQFTLLQPYIASTSTLLKVTAQSWSGPQQVWIGGTGLTYGADGLLTGGTITSMKLMDVSAAPVEIGRVTMPGGVSAASIATILGQAKGLASQLSSWNLEVIDQDDADVVTPTGVTMTCVDGSKVTVTIANWQQQADIGTVTSIIHYEPDGTTIRHQATGLPVPVSIAKMAFGDNGDIYSALTAGNNVVSGNSNGGYLDGGPGNDTITGISLDPGFNHNGVTYETAKAGVTVNLGATATYGTATGGGGNDRLVNIQNVDGSSFGDNLSGSATYNSFWGGGGNDTLLGRGGSDWLDGNEGNDRIDGGDDSDNIRGGAGNDTLIGGAGSDTVIYADYGDLTGASGVSVNLAVTGVQAIGGGHGTDQLIGIENVEGSAFGDKLTGNAADNRLRGNGGNDTLAGGGGVDWLEGGAGDDLYIASQQGQLFENALSGIDTVQTASAQFTLNQNFENLTYTGTAAFTGTGNEIANTISGRAGNDSLEGGAGNDTLNGGAGNDRLVGDSTFTPVTSGQPGIAMGSGQITKTAGFDIGSISKALDVSRQFSLAADPDIASATSVPHVSISATGGGRVDYYKVTLNRAGATIAADIDHGFGQSGSDQIMARVDIYDANGNSVSNWSNDPSDGAGGSTD